MYPSSFLWCTSQRNHDTSFTTTANQSPVQSFIQVPEENQIADWSLSLVHDVPPNNGSNTKPDSRGGIQLQGVGRYPGRCGGSTDVRSSVTDEWVSSTPAQFSTGENDVLISWQEISFGVYYGVYNMGWGAESTCVALEVRAHPWLTPCPSRCLHLQATKKRKSIY